MRRLMPPIVVGGVLSAILSYPTVIHPGSVTRMDTSDGKFSVWNVAWVAHALLHDPRHLFDANIFHPHRGTLAYSEPNIVAGALAIPPYVLSGNPVTAFNAVIYLSLLFSFVAMWALVSRLTGDSTAGLVSAAAFAFAPFVMARTAEIQLLMVFVFPLVFLAFHWFVEAPGWRRGAILGVAFGVAGLTCGYYAIFLGLALALAALWFIPSSAHRQYWTGLAAAAVVTAAIVAPILVPYMHIRADAGALRVFNREEAEGYSADLRSYLTSPSHAHRWWLRLIGTGTEVLFPGIVASVFAIAGLVGARNAPVRVKGFYVMLAGLAAWASFGPRAGLYDWLVRVVPFMSNLRAPARVGVVVTFAVTVLAGFGVAAIRRRRARSAWIGAALLLVTCADVAAMPWPLSAVPPISDAHRRLATLPRGAVAEFPFPYKRTDFHRHTRNMFYSMWHWQPLVNGYSDYIPPDFAAIALPINGFPDEESFRILRERSVRYVLIHVDEEGEGSMRVLSARFSKYEQYLRPLVKNETDWLYEIVDWP